MFEIIKKNVIPHRESECYESISNAIEKSINKYFDNIFLYIKNCC